MLVGQHSIRCQALGERSEVKVQPQVIHMQVKADISGARTGKALLMVRTAWRHTQWTERTPGQTVMLPDLLSPMLSKEKKILT